MYETWHYWKEIRSDEDNICSHGHIKLTRDQYSHQGQHHSLFFDKSNSDLCNNEKEKGFPKVCRDSLGLPPWRRC